MTTTLKLPVNLYGHYARISTTDLAVNDVKLQEQFNPDEPLEILYMRLTE